MRSLTSDTALGRAGVWRRLWKMIYDITTPHDLRGVLGKESITTEEIDAFIADVDADPAVKLRLLEDVEPQGYGPQGDA
jgi:hypothetical protein